MCRGHEDERVPQMREAANSTDHVAVTRLPHLACQGAVLKRPMTSPGRVFEAEVFAQFESEPRSWVLPCLAS